MHGIFNVHCSSLAELAVEFGNKLILKASIKMQVSSGQKGRNLSVFMWGRLVKEQGLILPGCLFGQVAHPLQSLFKQYMVKGTPECM